MLSLGYFQGRATVWLLLGREFRLKGRHVVGRHQAVPGCRDVADCMDRLDMDGVGCGARFAAIREEDDGTFVDEWGVTYKRNSEAVAHPLRGPIASIDDARVYTPPIPARPGDWGSCPNSCSATSDAERSCFITGRLSCGRRT